MELQHFEELFDYAIACEKMIGDFYGLIAKKRTEKNWKKFWLKMEMEENNHAERLQLQRRILSGEVKGLVAGNGAESLKKALQKVTEQIDHWSDIDASAKPIDRAGFVAEVIDVALKLEKLLEGAHTDQIIMIENRELKEFFSSLANEEKAHIARLKNVRERTDQIL